MAILSEGRFRTTACDESLRNRGCGVTESSLLTEKPVMHTLAMSFIPWRRPQKPSLSGWVAVAGLSLSYSYSSTGISKEYRHARKKEKKERSEGLPFLLGFHVRPLARMRGDKVNPRESPRATVAVGRCIESDGWRWPERRKKIRKIRSVFGLWENTENSNVAPLFEGSGVSHWT